MEANGGTGIIGAADERRTPRRARRVRRIAMALLAIGALAMSGCNYSVGLFGDVPYATDKEPAYQRLLADVNAAGVAFSTHVGDFQARTSTCTDANVQKNINYFDTLNNPLVYTPGDNDWTDCSSPLTRLDRLRAMVYRGTGTQSRGRTTMTLTSQASAGFPENARWTNGPVTYATLHVVGSSDGNANSAEFNARRQANIDWVRQAFAQVRRRSDPGLVFIAQAGLRFDRAEGDKGAYESIFEAIRSETMNCFCQVLYVHGDQHTFTNDFPMKTATGATVTNFHRVEVYGDPTVRWVKLTVDPDASQLFTITTPPAP